jgi:hypothetical protein
MLNPKTMPSGIGFHHILNKAIRGTLKLEWYRPNVANGKSQELEDELHDALAEYQFIPSTQFAGWTECFHLENRKEILAVFPAAKQKYEGQWRTGFLGFSRALMLAHSSGSPYQ